MGVKKWLNQILEILMGERAKSQQETENEKLNVLIKKHEELIPSVQKTSVMVDLYWKCYAYGDELKPHIEFLDGIMLSSTRDIAPSCAENNETIAAEFEVAEEEIKKVKKRHALDDAVSDLKKRQDLFNKSNTTISGLFKAINDNFTCMSITLPEDKKKLVGKEIAAVEVKLEVVGRFKETVAAQKMTTHAEADAEVAALKERYNKVKAVSDEWVKKVDILLKEWTLLDNTVTDLNSWVAKDKSSEGENQFSLGELKNIFKEKEKLVEGL